MARVLPLHLKLSATEVGESAGLYVLTQPGPHGVAHFLICGMDGEAPTPLEDAPPMARSLAPAVVPDDHGALTELLDEASQRPADFTAEDGRKLWKLSPEAARRARSLLDDVDIRPLASSSADHGTRAFAVAPLSDPGLRITPIHRGLVGHPSFDPATFLTVVKDYARIYDLEERLDRPDGLARAKERLKTMVQGHHAVLLVLPGGAGKLLRFRQALELSTFKAVPRSPTLRSLDLALLNALVFQTALGLKAEDLQPGGRVVPVYGIDRLVAQVNTGALQAGFALNAPPLWEIRAVMEAAQSLPALTMQLGPLPELPMPASASA